MVILKNNDLILLPTIVISAIWFAFSDNPEICNNTIIIDIIINIVIICATKPDFDAIFSILVSFLFAYSAYAKVLIAS